MKSFVIVLALLAVAAADVAQFRSPEADAVIVEQNADVLPDKFHYEFRTSNDIYGEQTGVLKNPGRDDEALEVQGYNGYTGPDGVRYETRYVANEFGYQPEAAHIPTPHPIPEYILRALDFIRTRSVAPDPRP